MKNQNILISVVVPTFNRKDRLSRCLDSIAANDLTSCEVIVIDDGSNDGTDKVINAQYSWVQYICKENNGVSSARNLGMEKAKGDFIAFIDSDDIWYPNRLRIIKIIISNLPQQVAILFNDMDKMVNLRGNGESFSDRYFGISRKYLLNSLNNTMVTELDGRETEIKYGNAYKDLIRGNVLQPSCVLIRRNVFINEGGYREDFRVANDSEYFLKISKKYQIAYVPLILTTIEPPNTEESLSNRKNSIEKITNMLITIKEHISDCSDKKIIQKLLFRKNELYSLRAYHYLSNLQLKEAQVDFRKAALTYPYKIKNFLFWLLSCSPRWVIQSVGRVKKNITSVLGN